MGRIAEKIKNWYRGKYIPPPENAPGSGVLFVMTGHYEPSLPAKIARALVRFWLKHWLVLLPVIVGAAVALFIHFDSNSNVTSKSEQKENHQITGANHASSSK
ncbi:hypothetical protein [Porticoccus sp.]